MKVIKRSGQEVPFDRGKIERALKKANPDVAPSEQVSDEEIAKIASEIEGEVRILDRAVSVEEIQDMVEDALIVFGHPRLMRVYTQYRFKHAMLRQENTTDARILSLVDRNNEEAKQENANKNPMINSTQRDYIAGEVSRDITKRLLLPEDVVQAWEEGVIWFHDGDYFVGHEGNCCLVNLEDMLQNGTVISGTMIEKPHSFATACNIATQIIAQVASNQYGGQSISLAHLAPFVDVSRQRLREEVRKELTEVGVNATVWPAEFEHEVNKIAEARLKKEIERGVQTIQYQIITLMTTNGQAPFVTTFMYIDEVPEGQLREDLVMIIRETLRQRIEGVKNECGVWITPAFP